MKVKKRNGTVEDFDPQKIFSAVEKAYKACGYEGIGESCKLQLNGLIELYSYSVKEVEDIENIQDNIETILMDTDGDVAKAFILYRGERARQRSEKLFTTIASKLRAESIDNQNANVDEHSFGGRMGEATRVVTKEYALNNCMSKMAKNNHLNNEIYVHDLDSYAVGMHNCLSVPLDDLLANGFTTRQISIRPAGSVNTAFQLVAVLFQLQSLQQFGGVSATHLDWTMVPYVRKSFTKYLGDGMGWVEGLSEYKVSRYHKWLEHDNNHPDGTIHLDDEEFKSLHPKAWEFAMTMLEREIYQAVEGMYHNLNSLQSRSGNQLPFTSINYGTCTMPEGRMITQALLECSLEGTGPFGETAIFPCGIFQCMKGVNRKPEDPNYDLFQLALQSTAKRLYPNYVNVDWSGNAGYDPKDPRTYFSTMGCRTANGWDINGFGQLKDGRGNICPVTIILPTLAMKARLAVDKKSAKMSEGVIQRQSTYVEKFMTILDDKIAEARDMLLERFDWICSQSSDAASFMWKNNTMAGYVPEEGIRSALKHGTLAIGQLGLAEALEILIGCNHTTKWGMDLADRIEQLFRDRCKEYKEKYKLNFGVYYTPAENLCYTAMKRFQDKYGVIPKVSDKEYFTNSIHIPVWEKVDPFQKIDLESKLTGYSSAGCITYVELPCDIQKNLSALEELVQYAMDKDIPYFAVNVPDDRCKDCGAEANNLDKCPKCGGKNIKRLRRVTGYLTSDYKTAFNLGKQAETEDRVKHVGHEVC